MSYKPPLPKCHFCRSEGKDVLAEFDTPTNWGWQHVCKKHLTLCGLGEDFVELTWIKPEAERREAEAQEKPPIFKLGHINRHRKEK